MGLSQVGWTSTQKKIIESQKAFDAEVLKTDWTVEVI